MKPHNGSLSHKQIYEHHMRNGQSEATNHPMSLATATVDCLWSWCRYDSNLVKKKTN
jgi:hypothetical protein